MDCRHMLKVGTACLLHVGDERNRNQGWLPGFSLKEISAWRSHLLKWESLRRNKFGQNTKCRCRHVSCACETPKWRCEGGWTEELGVWDQECKGKCLWDYRWLFKSNGNEWECADRGYREMETGHRTLFWRDSLVTGWQVPLNPGVWLKQGALEEGGEWSAAGSGQPRGALWSEKLCELVSGGGWGAGLCVLL